MTADLLGVFQGIRYRVLRLDQRTGDWRIDWRTDRLSALKPLYDAPPYVGP